MPNGKRSLGDVCHRNHVSLRSERGDRSPESVFTSIAQAIDSGLQASLELSTLTLDTLALLPKVGAALGMRLANRSEPSKRYCAWK